MLDICAGRLGWAKAFLARGWQVTAVDLVDPPEIPPGVTFIKLDVLKMRILKLGDLRLWTTASGEPNPFWEHPRFDFICASTPCQEFSLHGMRHFFPNPKFPEDGLRLFNHVQELCEQSKAPYIMENVRAAQKFVGKSVHRCGPFHLWGNAVPPLMNQGIRKGLNQGRDPVTGKRDNSGLGRRSWSTSPKRKEDQAIAAEIPPELANCVAEYAERILECRELKSNGTSSCEKN